MQMKYILIIIFTLAVGNSFAQQNTSSDGVPIYYPVNDHNSPTAYIGIPFKVNGEYKNRDGDYKVELRICDASNLCIGKLFVGPYAQFTSSSPEDAGKDIEITTYFRATNSADWKKLRSDHAKIAPAPLAVIMLDKIIPKDDQHIQAYYGIEGYSTPPKSDILEVESEGYFEPTAVKSPKAAAAEKSEETQPLHEEMAPLSSEYILKPTDRFRQLGIQKNITLTFRDPKTGRNYTKSVTLLPPAEASR